MVRIYRNDDVVLNKYVGPPYCRAEVYADRVACFSLVSRNEYTDGTDRQTDARPLRYTMLSARRGQLS